MTTVTINRKVYGSTEEAMHESWTYTIDTSEAAKMGDTAGLISKGVTRKQDGYEFFLLCSESEAMKRAMERGIELIFKNN